MLVICNGMPRSASTWSYNVVLGLLRGSDPKAVVHAGYDESVGRFLEAAPPEATHAVLKCHSLDAHGLSLLHVGAARAIYTKRDPADAVVSCMRMFGYGFERALKEVGSSLALHRFHRQWGTALIVEYALIREEPEEAVAQVAAHLGLPKGTKLVRDVAQATSFDSVKATLDAVEPDLAGDDSSTTGYFAHDRATLLHRGHIKDGGTGYGRQALTAAQLERVEARARSSKRIARVSPITTLERERDEVAATATERLESIELLKAERDLQQRTAAERLERIEELRSESELQARVAAERLDSIRQLKNERDVQQRAAAERQRVIESLRTECELLTRVAAERLEAIEALREECALQGAAAQERLASIDVLRAELAVQTQAAAERLAVIEGMRADQSPDMDRSGGGRQPVVSGNEYPNRSSSQA